MAGNRDETGKFTKGQSGNPGGRKKIPEEVKKMLNEATPLAIKLLIDTIGNEEVKPELRVSCANTIIDRVLGKAAQPIEHSGAVAEFKVDIKVID